MEPSNYENQIYTYTPVTAAPPQRRGWSALQALVVVALVAFAALGGGIAGSVLTARTVLTMMPKAQVVTAQDPAVGTDRGCGDVDLTVGPSGG